MEYHGTATQPALPSKRHEVSSDEGGTFGAKAESPTGYWLGPLESEVKGKIYEHTTVWMGLIMITTMDKRLISR